MKLHGVRFVAAMLLLVCTVGPVVADQQSQESRILSDKWYFSAGTSLTSFSTEASIGFGTVLGSFIRIEDDLNLEDDQTSFRFNGIYAFNPKHSIDFTVTDYSRDGEIEIDEEIVIGEDGDETVFAVGALVATEFDSRNFKVFYKYSFVNTGRSQAGIGAGLSFFDYKFGFEGVASVNDETAEFTRVDESIVAPIPSFLMFIHHAIKPKLIFRMTAGFFDLDVDDFKGRLIETRFTLDYFITKRFAVGGGAEGSTIDFKDSGEDPLTIEVSTRGLIFYVAGVF